jgi:hypothetical protein
VIIRSALFLVHVFDLAIGLPCLLHILGPLPVQDGQALPLLAGGCAIDSLSAVVCPLLRGFFVLLLWLSLLSRENQIKHL